MSDAGASDKSATMYYDGECVFCCRCAEFVRKRDKQGRISLTPIQNSKHSRSDKCYESIIYISDGKQSKYSTAVVEVLKDVGGIWKIMGWLLWLVPRPIRDWGYRFVGRRRYWFN